MPIRNSAALALASLLFLAFASPCAASRYLPLDHWANEGVRFLRTAGYLDGLNPLAQPYTRAEIAVELRDLDPASLPRGLRHWARLLREEFADDIAPPPSGDDGGATALRWGGWLSGGARGSTGARLDPLRPIGDTDGWPFGRAGLWLTKGPLTGDLGVLADQYLDKDPDGLDPQLRLARTETGYLALSGGLGEILVGRIARNWSRIGTDGVMVSAVASTYPQIGLMLNAGNFTFRSFVGELDTLASKKRYIAAHRLDYERPNLVISIGESMLSAQDGAGFSLRHLSPVEVLFFDADTEPQDVVPNLLLNLNVWTRRGNLELYGEAMLDEIDLPPAEGPDREPTLYAYTVGGRMTTGNGWIHALGLEWTRVSAWAYRTPNGVDQYTYLQRGLGEAYTDFDRVTLSADLFPPVDGLRLTPAFAFLKKGEGSFLDPVPKDEMIYHFSPELFLGDVRSTRRWAVRGRYQPRSEVWLDWDLGVNFADEPCDDGDDGTTCFEGMLEAGFRFDVLPWERLLR